MPTAAQNKQISSHNRFEATRLALVGVNRGANGMFPSDHYGLVTDFEWVRGEASKRSLEDRIDLADDEEEEEEEIKSQKRRRVAKEMCNGTQRGNKLDTFFKPRNLNGDRKEKL
eukprot:GDKJ01028992.1.p2 GENE.GDKJ01028992.1~~GDKJ01028992.1.p2  ORF type:complete len:114 (-),score=30.45 GDKJ01028992.1:34-375(-)